MFRHNQITILTPS